MNKLKGVCVATSLLVCSLTWMAVSPAQNSNNSKPKPNIDNAREPDPPKVGTSKETAKEVADRENAKERERVKARARANKTKPKPKEPPSPKNNR